jgi:hypothetical protein
MKNQTLCCLKRKRIPSVSLRDILCDLQSRTFDVRSSRYERVAVRRSSMPVTYRGQASLPEFRNNRLKRQSRPC